MEKLVFITVLMIVSLPTALAQSAEQTAIRTVIERETQSWLNRDAEAMARCWAAVPYATHLGLRADGNAFFTTNEPGQIAQNIRHVSLNAAQPDRSTFANANYRIRMNGSGAFVTFAQVRTAPNGHVDPYYQSRYVEKQHGARPIVHAGALFRQPETN